MAAQDSDWTEKPVIPTIPRPRPPQDRRLVAVGVVRRCRGRVLHLTATAAGATGRIQQQGGGR